MSSLWTEYKRPILAFLGAGALASALYCKYAEDCCQVVTVDPHKKEVLLPLPLRDTKANPSLNVEAMKRKQVLEDVDFTGKRVLIRVDYNVPVEAGVITDTRRIDETLATIKHVLSYKVKCIVLIAHLGRPGKDYNPKKYSLEPCVKVLQNHLPDTKVEFLTECVGPAVEQAVNSCAPGTVFLLENLRFHVEEADEGVDSKETEFHAKPEDVIKFKQDLSRLGDVFVFEAFGAAHRPHASVVGIDLKQRVAGKLMAKEMEVYSNVLGSASRPFVAIIGGAKVSDKVAVIENLLDRCDEMIIGGGMAYTFKKVIYKMKIGKSLFEEKAASMVERIVKIAAEKNVKLHLPVDHIIADKIKGNPNIGVTDDQMGIPDGWMGLDVGPRTRAINSAVIARAKTVLWNGPLGVYEEAPFAAGTLSAMWDMAQATKNGTYTIIGGGDTGAACAKFFCGSNTIDHHISHVSTGGGSSLVLMEGKMLPAIVALSDKVSAAR